MKRLSDGIRAKIKSLVQIGQYESGNRENGSQNKIRYEIVTEMKSPSKSAGMVAILFLAGAEEVGDCIVAAGEAPHW